jgi:hypothetical protein
MSAAASEIYNKTAGFYCRPSLLGVWCACAGPNGPLVPRLMPEFIFLPSKHTHKLRDVPRCQALSFLQKPLHHREDSAEIVAELKRKLYLRLTDCVPACVARIYFDGQYFYWAGKVGIRKQARELVAMSEPKSTSLLNFSTKKKLPKVISPWG